MKSIIHQDFGKFQNKVVNAVFDIFSTLAIIIHLQLSVTGVCLGSLKVKIITTKCIGGTDK